MSTMTTVKLITFRADGRVVHPGDAVTDFRGEQVTFVEALRATTPGKSGYVVTSREGFKSRNYDNVFNLSVLEMPEVTEDELGLYWSRLAIAARELHLLMTAWAPQEHDTPAYREEYPLQVSYRLEQLERAILGLGV